MLHYLTPGRMRIEICFSFLSSLGDTHTHANAHTDLQVCEEFQYDWNCAPPIGKKGLLQALRISINEGLIGVKRHMEKTKANLD